MIFLSSRSGFQHPVSSEITPEAVYQRRALIRQARHGLGRLGFGGLGYARCAAQMARPGQLPPLASVPTKLAVPVMDKLTPYKDATTYNNFYEFGTDKADPAKRAHTLKTDPGAWRSRAWSRSPPAWIWKT
jgi:methionine sulfoxide reductase catalytic subunit